MMDPKVVDSVESPQDLDTPHTSRYRGDTQAGADGIAATASRSTVFTDVDEDIQVRRTDPPVYRPDGAMGPLPRMPPDFVVPRAPVDSHHIPSPAMGYKPEPYDGESDWSEYLISYEQYGNFLNWDDRTRAAMLGFCLRGPARSVLASLPVALRLDYKVLTEALT